MSRKLRGRIVRRDSSPRPIVDSPEAIAAMCAPCEHDWMEFGGPGDEWRECFLCGRQEDA